MITGDNILEHKDLKNPPFTVPDGYFETLPQKVAERVAADGKTSGRKVALKKWWPAAAAACVAVLSVGILLLSSDSKTFQRMQENKACTTQCCNSASGDCSNYDNGLSKEAIIEYLYYIGTTSSFLYDQLNGNE